jgi:hypothetical protein
VKTHDAPIFYCRGGALPRPQAVMTAPNKKAKELPKPALFKQSKSALKTDLNKKPKNILGITLNKRFKRTLRRLLPITLIGTKSQSKSPYVLIPVVTRCRISTWGRSISLKYTLPIFAVITKSKKPLN